MKAHAKQGGHANACDLFNVGGWGVHEMSKDNFKVRLIRRGIQLEEVSGRSMTFARQSRVIIHYPAYATGATAD
jgi:hypothetical protein